LENNITNITNFTSQLDYTIDSTQERLNKLSNIVTTYDATTDDRLSHSFFSDYFSNYYNPNISQATYLSDKNPVCIGLSYMAGYVLFNKEEETKDIVKEKTQNYRNKKHISLNTIIEEQGEETLSQQTGSPAKYKIVKPKITAADREKIPPLADMEVFISSLVSQMEREQDPKEKFRLKKILIEARQDQYAIKEAYTVTAKFHPDMTSTKYNFDEDTGYYSDEGEYVEISTNTIDLSNPKHIYQLLNHYSALRQQHYDDTNSDMKYILDTLDDLITKTSLKTVFSRVLVQRIDGVPYEDIANGLSRDLGVNLTVSYLSSSFANVIPKEIAKTYVDSYEEWYYTYKEKGDYKKCRQCGKNYLRSDKYFRKDSKNKVDGLSNICKECRRKAEKEKRVIKYG
jgi:hypothetical protein